MYRAQVSGQPLGSAGLALNPRSPPTRRSPPTSVIRRATRARGASPSAPTLVALLNPYPCPETSGKACGSVDTAGQMRKRAIQLGKWSGGHALATPVPSVCCRTTLLIPQSGHHPCTRVRLSHISAGNTSSRVAGSGTATVMDLGVVFAISRAPRRRPVR